MFYKYMKCGDCVHSDQAPHQGGPINLKAPKILICRHSPPQIVYAMSQDRAINRPVPIPLGSMHPIIDENYQACSYFDANNTMSIDPPKED